MPSPGLVARITRARRSLERLRRLAEMSWEEYSVDEDAQALAERHLHVLLEAILGTAAFVAARRGASRSPTYRGVMEALVGAGLIPRELRGLALAAPGTRNILVHGYAEVRHDLVYETLRNDLDSLARLPSSSSGGRRSASTPRRGGLVPVAAAPRPGPGGAGVAGPKLRPALHEALGVVHVLEAGESVGEE